MTATGCKAKEGIAGCRPTPWSPHATLLRFGLQDSEHDQANKSEFSNIRFALFSFQAKAAMKYSDWLLGQLGEDGRPILTGLIYDRVQTPHGLAVMKKLVVCGAGDGRRPLQREGGARRVLEPKE